jgi:O-acetyl-ADP-ribose deacetylase (regulator of RNase III)
VQRHLPLFSFDGRVARRRFRVKELAIGDKRIRLLRGDITRERVDAIVNAANSRLMGGGGVDGAIHAAGGPAILEECAAIRAEKGGCPPGQAVITTAGRLPAKKVIHAVGPVWRGGSRGEQEVLASCYRQSLKLAAAHGLRTIAFPSIGTGAYGYPIELAAPVALRTVADEMKALDIEETRFILFAESDLETYSRALDAIANELRQRRPERS